MSSKIWKVNETRIYKGKSGRSFEVTKEDYGYGEKPKYRYRIYEKGWRSRNKKKKLLDRKESWVGLRTTKEGVKNWLKRNLAQNLN